MSKPEHIKRWWGNLGDGYSVPVCEVDLRAGGKWRFVNRHPHGEAEFYGEYREINPPERIVFTEIFAPFPDAESVCTVELAEEGGKTRFTITARYPSLDVRNGTEDGHGARRGGRATTGWKKWRPNWRSGAKGRCAEGRLASLAGEPPSAEGLGAWRLGRLVR